MAPAFVLLYIPDKQETMETLAKIFGSEARVRILRLFFLSPDKGFESREVSLKTKTNPATAKKELKILHSAGVIRKFSLKKKVVSNKGKIKHVRIDGWILDKAFRYREQLKAFVVSVDLVKKHDIINRFEKAGKIKLLIIAGIFIKDDSSRTDIFIVGDKLKKSRIEKIISSLEAEAGKEIRYALLETPEFKYRLEFYDKFIRDVLDYPHEKVINKLSV